MGGVVPASAAAEIALGILDSGPTAGLTGAAALAAANGHRNVVTTDMGGTSFDIGLVVDGQPIVADESVIDQYTYRLPHLDVRTTACGGGTIAQRDPQTGALRVGPDSAGAEPGPACYGRGGTQATVTDADVVLGLLRPDSFLAGRMPLDETASRTVVGRLADALGLGLEETAAGLVNVNNLHAATLIHQQTLERGLDPRDFVLYSYGGAGPVHAFGYAAEIGVREVLIPLGNGASTLSAYGIAAGDVARFVEVETALQAPFDDGVLSREVAGAVQRARQSMLDAGVAGDPQIDVWALMRYQEQLMHRLEVPLDPADRGGYPAGGGGLAERLAAQFTQEYARRYGASAASAFQAAEIFALRVRARVPAAVGGIASTAAAAPGLALHDVAPADVDPVTFEVIRYALLNANVEHGQTLQRLCVSPITMLTRDFQPSILTERGELVFLGPYLQYFSNAQALTVKWILENRSADPGIGPGDMFLSNDPYVGAPHQPDTTIAAPVFVGDQLFCWVANVLHHSDVGGSVVGSFCVDAADIFTDPSAFPPFKIVEAGRIRPDMEQVFLRQSRLPGVVQMDLRAAISANTVTVRKIEALAGRYGADTVKAVMGKVIDAGEALFLDRLRQIPDGTWSHRLYAEASHTGDTGLYRYELTVRKRGDELVVDNAGTDPQAGSINVTYAGLVGAFLSALTALLTPDLAGAYGGVYRRVRFEPVPGTLSCADFPAAVSPAGVYTMELLISLSGSVIAKMMAAGPPELRDRALGPAQPHWYGTIIAGQQPSGAPYIAVNANNMIGALPAWQRYGRHRLRRALLDPRGHRQQYRGDRAALSHAVPVPQGAAVRGGWCRSIPGRSQHDRGIRPLGRPGHGGRALYRRFVPEGGRPVRRQPGQHGTGPGQARGWAGQAVRRGRGTAGSGRAAGRGAAG